jgi:hypothetical protein
MKICGAVHVERWESDGKPREREVRCTLPPGHTGRHGWELDKGPVRTFDPASLLLDQLNAPGSDELAIRYIVDGIQTRDVQDAEPHPLVPTFDVPYQEGEVRSYFENGHGERFVASATQERLLVTTDDTDWEEYVVKAPDYAKLVAWLEQPGWIPPPELGLMMLNAEERVWLLSVCMSCARNQ